LTLKTSLDDTQKVKTKNILALSITKVMHGFGIAMFTVIYQPFILEITKSLFITGIIVSIGSIMQFLPMPLIGRLSDKIGHKNSLIASIPIYILGLISLIYANASTIFLLVFGIIMYFLATTFNSMNAQFLVSINSKRSKGLMYGIVFASYFIGTIMGGAFIIIGTEFETQFFFLLFIILLGVEALILFLFISNDIPIKDINEEVRTTDIMQSEKIWLKFVKNRRMRTILIFFTLDIFTYGISLSIYNGGLNDYYHLTPDQISSIVIWMNLTNMIFQIPAGRITDKLGKMKTILLSQVFGLAFFILNIAASLIWEVSIVEPVVPLLIIGHILFAFSIVLFIPSEQIMLTDLGERRKAESYGIVTFVRGLGYIPTGVIGGILIESISYISPFIITSIGILIEIWFILKFFKHEE